ncbi:hypothetical protein [Ruminococcus sp.]|nr:hypothetical protein [Ruminococcus sp.]HNZ98846.1 hypothetical protein [Ruminococcus sp.]HOH86259.1 hypothetical protein [Ruminococcus sp.]
MRKGVISKKTVKDFYDHAFDSTEIINDILADLDIDSVETLLED